jgi:hypothetical protein
MDGDMKTYAIFNSSGLLVGSQTWEDQFAPILTPGGRAVPQSVGFAEVDGIFSGVSAGGGIAIIPGTFNITLSGAFVATVVLERSFDGGSTWFGATLVDDTPISWQVRVSTWWSEPESNVMFRLRCTAFTSGSIGWRLSQ